jgi:U3 small nucleolar RNA-associated protein 10
VLLKTRHESPKVRFAALKVIDECYARIGEELLVLLPETIPFLSELMEDSNSDVEKLCSAFCKRVEQWLGPDAMADFFS